jgi:hypothetical protein
MPATLLSKEASVMMSKDATSLIPIGPMECSRRYSTLAQAWTDWDDPRNTIAFQTPNAAE